MITFIALINVNKYLCAHSIQEHFYKLFCKFEGSVGSGALLEMTRTAISKWSAKTKVETNAIVLSTRSYISIVRVTSEIMSA